MITLYDRQNAWEPRSYATRDEAADALRSLHADVAESLGAGKTMADLSFEDLLEIGDWEAIENPFAPGQVVRLKADGREYHVYAVEDAETVTLCLYGYTDAEQDITTHVDELEPRPF